MGRRMWLALALAIAAVSLALFAAACGDDGDGGDDGAPSPTAAETQVQADDDAAEVEAFLRAFYDDFNSKDVDAVLAAVTDKLLQDELGVPREQAPEALAEFIGEPPQIITEISNIEVSGDTATAEVAYNAGKISVLEREFLVRENDAWLFDGFDPLPQEIPAGATAVDLTLTEYKFTFDEATITGGNIAFNVSNIGGAQHQVALFTADPGVDVVAQLQQNEVPAAVQEVAFAGPYDPGSDATIVFTQALDPGRYVMVCFVETADGEPHYLKGMVAEFTIQ